MSNSDEVSNLVYDFANDLALAEAYPLGWTTWMVQLLQTLDEEAQNLDKNHPKDFELMLKRLRDAIDDRLNKHTW